MKKKVAVQAKNNLVIYQTKSGALELRGDVHRETVWATQVQISELFGIERSVITKHIIKYQKFPELNIPNTTNTIDGYFASVKKKVAAHHGLRKDRRYKVISELLNKS